MGYEIEYSKYKKGANKVLSQASSDIGVETNGFAWSYVTFELTSSKILLGKVTVSLDDDECFDE